MANNYHQLSLKDTFSDCKDMFMDDVPSFFQLLEQHFDISLFIPQTFYNAFYQHLGRKRDYPLTGFLSALILQKIFPIPTDSLLILLLNNNPKTLNALIRRLKAYYKDNPDVDPYKMAYGLMPSQAASCPDAKQQYINGHFCYADKFSILTNVRTIVERAIDHLKINMCVAGRKSRNHTTTKADVFLAGIASQLTVIVAHSMNCPQYIRSLKPLIA